MISGGIVVIFGYGNMEYLRVYIRSLQLILLIPGIPIVLPANVISYFQMIKSVADYDILNYINIWDFPLLN